MPENLTKATVTEIPICQLCKEHPAEYDGKTSFGPWAYMCKECFDHVGIGLGMGKGQRLVLAAN